MAMPLDRAFGGRNVKKRRAGLAQVEKGLNLAVTSVMNLVIILTAGAQRARNNAAGNRELVVESRPELRR